MQSVNLHIHASREGTTVNVVLTELNAGGVALHLVDDFDDHRAPGLAWVRLATALNRLLVERLGLDTETIATLLADARRDSGRLIAAADGFDAAADVLFDALGDPTEAPHAPPDDAADSQERAA